MKTFDELFDGVIKHEGYYANVEGDRGGETYMGVARNLHPDWEGWKYIDAYKETYGKIKWNFKIDSMVTPASPYIENLHENIGPNNPSSTVHSRLQFPNCP